MSTQTPAESAIPVEGLIRPRVLAERFDICARTLDALIAAGEFDVVIVGRRDRRITESSVRRYLERHRR